MKKSRIAGVVSSVSLVGIISFLYYSKTPVEPTSVIVNSPVNVSLPSNVTVNSQPVVKTTTSNAISVDSSRTTTLVPALQAAPQSTTTTSGVPNNFPLIGCSTQGSNSTSAPIISEVDNPNPTNFQVSSEFLIKGTNLKALSEVLFCPSAGTSEPVIQESIADIAGGVNQVNVYVSNQLVAGAVYDVRIIANGMISTIIPTDRLYVANILQPNSQI